MSSLSPPGSVPESKKRSASLKPLLFKTLALAMGVLVLHSAYLWWSLTPDSQDNDNDSGLAQVRLQRGVELPNQPKGDLFVPGRERQDENLDSIDEPSQQEQNAASDYALLAVLTIGSTYYALFDNGAEQQKLMLGDTLPGRGTITHIDRRRVRISNPDTEDEEQQFMLFPTLQAVSQ